MLYMYNKCVWHEMKVINYEIIKTKVKLLKIFTLRFMHQNEDVEIDIKNIEIYVWKCRCYN